MSYSKISLFRILSIIIDENLVRGGVVVTSPIQCSFCQITSFGVGNRGRKVKISAVS